MSDVILTIQKSIMIAGMVSLAIAVGAVAYVYLRDAAHAVVRHLRKRSRAVAVLVFAIAAILYGGSKPSSPPIVQEEGIKVLTYTAPITGGMTMTWETTDNRIVLGQDEFIIKCRERQIPARTGWSAWREIGRTKETKISKDGFWRNRDIQLRIEVEKGAIE